MLTTVKDTITRSAIFDGTGHYRYSLKRRWQKHGKKVAFIMLNPSQANADHDDPTLRACSQFAQGWNYAALEVVNLFAYRTPHPQQLKTANFPVGEENDTYIRKAVKTSAQVILAWGNWGCLHNRHQATLNLIKSDQHKLFYLALNQSGQPRHPLYLKRSTRPLPWVNRNSQPRP